MKKSPSFKMYVLLSIAVHIFIVVAFIFFDSLKTPTPPSETVSINFLSADDLKKMALVEVAAQKKAKNSQSSKNQVVEQSEISANEEVPENSRFLSAKNQKVKKETIAAQHGQFQNIKKSNPSIHSQKGDGKERAIEPTDKEKKVIAKNLFKGFDAGEALQTSNQKAAANVNPGEGLGDNEANTGTGADASQSSDYAKDIDVGLETMLNTREFKYYSYYNRIRKQLSQHWESRVRDKLTKLFHEGRAPAATTKDRITKLMIVLNDRGTLVRVQVLSDSGIRDLDDAAIEAFRAAAPFPNPPKGIIEGDGTVKIRWDFVLET